MKGVFVIITNFLKLFLKRIFVIILAAVVYSCVGGTFRVYVAILASGKITENVM